MAMWPFTKPKQPQRSSQPARPSRPHGCTCERFPFELRDGAKQARPCRQAVYDGVVGVWRCKGVTAKPCGSCGSCGSSEWRDVSPSFVQCPRGHQDLKVHVGWPASGGKTADDAWTEYLEANSTAAERAESNLRALLDRVRLQHFDLPVAQLVDCIENFEWVAWATEQPLPDVPRDLDRNGMVYDPAAEARADSPAVVSRRNMSPNPGKHRSGCLCSRCRAASEVNAGSAFARLAMQLAPTDVEGQVLPLSEWCNCEYDTITSAYGQQHLILSRPCVMHSTPSGAEVARMYP